MDIEGTIRRSWSLVSMLALTFGLASRVSACELDVVNHQPDSGLAQHYEVAVQRAWSSSGLSTGLVRAHLMAAQFEEGRQRPERSSVIYAITDESDGLMTSNRCNSNIEQCSIEIVTSARKACDARRASSGEVLWSSGAKPGRREGLVMRGYESAVAAKAVEARGQTPNVRSCRVRLVGAREEAGSSENPVFRVYYIVSNADGKLLGGDDCIPRPATGRCVPKIVIWANALCEVSG